jgi:hypothetical protein
MALKVLTGWTGLKFLNNLSWDQQLSLAVTSLGAVAAVVIYASYGPGSSFYYSLIAATTASLLFDRITRYSFENQTVKELTEANLRPSDLHYIENSAAGLAWFCEHYSQFRTVYNTLYRPRDGRFGYIETEYERYTDAIKKCIDEGCGWFDLVLPGQRPAAEAFYGSLSETQKARYRADELILQDEVPIFQVTVFKYKNDDRASVSFGWGFADGRDSRVFVSTDPKIVSYFDDYYRVLQSKARPLFRPADGSDMSASRPTGALPGSPVVPIEVPAP